MTTTSRSHAAASELARKMWRTLEPYHGIVYFTPHAAPAYAALGIEGSDGYFASRAAPMGAVNAEVVIATFYNFHPRLVRRAVPAAWEKASPGAAVAARLGVADAALREVLGQDRRSAAMTRAADLARRAAGAAPLEGRPLFAGHAGLPWPEEPHLVLWHAITLLREYRGDGHVAALVESGLDGCEALITHAGAGDVAITASVLRSSRAWPDDEWEAAGERLRSRGLLEGDQLSDAGWVLRAELEERTDRAAAGPWAVLSDDEAEELRRLVRPWSRAIVEGGVFGFR
jgi:hypothetical protein